MSVFTKTGDFRKTLENLSREDLLDIIRVQDPELIKQINRIEWVFENKLSHLSWNDGSPVLNRKMTNRELALLVDEPFEVEPSKSAFVSITLLLPLKLADCPYLPAAYCISVPVPS